MCNIEFLIDGELAASKPDRIIETEDPARGETEDGLRKTDYEVRQPGVLSARSGSDSC